MPKYNTNQNLLMESKQNKSVMCKSILYSKPSKQFSLSDFSTQTNMIIGKTVNYQCPFMI